MAARLKVDKLGRIVLPKAVREKLQLAPGDELELESLDDRITLRPLRGTAQLRKSAASGSFIAAGRYQPRRLKKPSSRSGANAMRGTSAKAIETVL
jgi:AbrB family looped-hinge helix DNA binding protein